MLISSAFYSTPVVKFPALCGEVPKGGNRYLACIICSAHVFLTHPEQSIRLEQKCTPVDKGSSALSGGQRLEFPAGDRWEAGVFELWWGLCQSSGAAGLRGRGPSSAGPGEPRACLQAWILSSRHHKSMKDLVLFVLC